MPPTKLQQQQIRDASQCLNTIDVQICAIFTKVRNCELNMFLDVFFITFGDCD